MHDPLDEDRDGLYGEIVDFLAVHDDPRHDGRRSLVRRGAGRLLEEEIAGAAAVRAQHEGQAASAGLVDARDHRGAGSVAEEHRGGTILPIGDPAELFGSDHDGVPAVAGFQHGGGYVERVEEARAARHHVESRAAERAYLFLDDAGCGGKAEIVGRGGRHDDEVEVVRGNLRLGQGGSGGLDRHVAGEHAVVRDMSGSDARVGPDPLIVRVELARERIVVHSVLRNIGCDGT